MSVSLFRSRMRNKATHRCIGNGMEGNGMEWITTNGSQNLLHLRPVPRETDGVTAQIGGQP